jgi:hypothetical protein
MKLKKEKGITLIALVVTIVVLLILAGVSTNILFSDSGLIEKAQNSGLKIRAAQVEEVVANWKQSNFINSSINKQKETADKMLEDLISKKLVTEDEIDREQEKIIIKKKDGTIVKEISYSDIEIVISKTPEKEKSRTVNLKVESVKGVTMPNIKTKEEVIKYLKSLSDERKKEMLKEQMVPFINKEDSTANCQTFEDVLKWMKNKEIIAEETESAFWNWTQSVNKVEGLTNVEAILGEQLEFLYLDKSTGEIIGYSVINPDEQISGTYIATENGTYTFKIQDLITGKTYYKKVEVTNIDKTAIMRYKVTSTVAEYNHTLVMLSDVVDDKNVDFENAYIIYKGKKIEISKSDFKTTDKGENCFSAECYYTCTDLVREGKMGDRKELLETTQTFILVKDGFEYEGQIYITEPIKS